MNRPRAAVLGVGLVVVAVGSGLAAGALGVAPGNSVVPTEARETARFVDQAAIAGIDHAYTGDWPFFVGGGVAAFDCSADGRPDLYFAGGSSPAALYRNATPIGGDLRFERLTDPTTDLADVTGAYPLDIEGDGNADLVVLRAGENVLLRGIGDCRFERANEALGFEGGDAWTTAFSATWEMGAPLPTLAFGNYVSLDAAGDWDGTCIDNVLVQAQARGTTYTEPVALSPGWCALSMLFSDWDRSGRRDLRVSNDRHYYSDYSDGQEQLWRIEPGKEPRQYTEADGWKTLRIFGMGIASQDLTGDGTPEVYLTNQADNKLQTLDGEGTGPAYRDIALERGVEANRPYVGDTDLYSTGWHAQFDDTNDDGFLDLFVAKGNVEEQPGYAMADPNNLLVGQPDGTFRESGEQAGIATFLRSRGAALVDLDLDGRLDLVVVNRLANVELWHNQGSADPAAAHWLAVRLRDRAPNRHAIGARLAVRSGDWLIEREVTVGGGQAGGQLGPIHFGLGPVDRPEIRVTWPDGEVGPWQRVHPDRFVIVERGAEPVPWTPTPN